MADHDVVFGCQTEQLTKLGLTITDEFQALWRDAATQLENELAKKEAGVGSLLAYLYWRFAPVHSVTLHAITVSLILQF
jgi:hypothetical protein